MKPRSSPGGPVLLLGRVAGLPGSSIDEFSSDLCSEWTAGASELERELAAAREALVGHLFDAIPQAPPEERRFLLAVKRAAFNGRPLARFREAAGETVAPALERVLALEDRRSALGEAFASRYRSQRAREHRALLGLLDDPGFRRGLALASPELAEAAERARRGSGRREARLDSSLLRYASRAILKLSPFSTLTRLAVGALGEEEGSPVPGALGSAGERSLFRAQRYLLEQDLELLRRVPAFRGSLKLAVNPTLWEAAPGRYRLVRPERWVLDETSGRLRHENASLSEVALPPDGAPGGVVATLRNGSRRYRELLGSLLEELGGADAVPLATALLETLLRSGVILEELPWPGHEPHFEASLLAHIKSLPADPGWTPVIAALEDLLALELGYPNAAEPTRSIAAIDQALDTLWRAEVSRAELTPAPERSRNRPADFREDVLIEGPPFQIPAGVVRRILRTAEPWWRLTAFQTFRFDFLHALAELQRRLGEGRSEMGFLELFTAAQPLWRDFRQLQASGALPFRASFNPLGLAEVEALGRLRAEVWSTLKTTVQRQRSGDLSRELSSLAEQIPPRYGAPVGPCLFVQPADETGAIWVLNRIFEGTGRYGSRFTGVMTEDLRERFVAPYRRAALLDLDEGRGEAVDLMWSRGDTLNVHAAETARVIALPGETLGQERAAPLPLAALRVVQPPPSGLPHLLDAGGRRILPVHLGGSALRQMPFLVQFLAQWGPGEVRPLPSPVVARRDGPVEIFERLTVENLVLARRRWRVSLGESLRRDLASSADDKCFQMLQDWRIERNLPQRLFWIEKTHYDDLGDTHKPQYLDFTSPLFVEVFRSALRLNGDPLTFEEALPAPGDLPRGFEGGRWAFELQIDSFPLRGEAMAGDPGLSSEGIDSATGGGPF